MTPALATASHKATNKVVVPLGLTQPALFDTISQNGRPVPMAGTPTVLFFMRPLLSRTPVINGATSVPIDPPLTAPDPNTGANVKYQWQAADVATEGDYMAWWRFTLSSLGAPEETPEFPILITDHGPGAGTQTGMIAAGARAYLPVTFDALQRDSRFGDRQIQHITRMIQLKVLGSAAAPDSESAYEEVLLDFFSKRLAHALIDPGLEYWSRQAKTMTKQSPTEIVSYPDMVQTLKDLRHRLERELFQDWRQLKLITGVQPERTVMHYPASSLGAVGPTTMSPYNGLPLQTGPWGWDLALGVFPFP